VGAGTLVSLDEDPRSYPSAIAPKEGVLFGGWARPEGGRTYAEERARLEDRIGRRFDAYRWWLTMDSVVDDQSLTFMRELLGDRVPIVGFTTSHGGGQARWAAVADGRYDERIAATAKALHRYGEPMIVVIDHEPEADAAVAGSPADYQRMFRHVAGMFRELAPQVEVAFVLTSMTYREGQAGRWYPGDDAVDWVGADGYNWSAGRGWRSCPDIFEAFHRFGTADDRDKPLLIAEFGTMDDPAVPARSAQWLDECRDWVASRPAIKVVAYFHAYEWVLEDAGGQALAAFRAWGADPRFRPDRR